MLLHSFSLFFPPDCKPGISHQCVTLKKFPSYQDCLPQSMLYNRLIFYSYYLTVIWIRVIRKGEESTHKSPVEIEWTAGIHLPKSTGGTAAFEAVSATGNSMSPVPPSETSLGAAQQQFAGARPWAELRGLTWEGKQNNLQTCWGKSAALRYLPALPHHGILPCQPLGSQLPFTFTLAQELPLWLFSVLLTFWSWREAAPASFLSHIHRGELWLGLLHILTAARSLHKPLPVLWEELPSWHHPPEIHWSHLSDDLPGYSIVKP